MAGSALILALVGTVAVLVADSDRADHSGAPAPTAPSSAGPGPSAPTPAGSAPSGPAPSSPAPSSPAASGPGADGALRTGMTGPAVLAVQQRLVSLGYWLGVPDGSFGADTRHAVVAFQKASGLRRDGVVGATTRATLGQAVRPHPRSTGGRVVEVDRNRQLLLLAFDGRVEWVFDASTGRVPGSTPAGSYRVFRQVDGYDRGPLGTLYRPKYFVGGVAVHGYPNVPPYPASHGCVRVTNAAMDRLWASGVMPIGQAVLVY